jgi:hypothetical protein
MGGAGGGAAAVASGHQPQVDARCGFALDGEQGADQRFDLRIVQRPLHDPEQVDVARGRGVVVEHKRAVEDDRRAIEEMRASELSAYPCSAQVLDSRTEVALGTAAFTQEGS